MTRRAILGLLLMAAMARAQGDTPIRGPQWFQDSLIYFNGFEQGPDAPAINTQSLTSAVKGISGTAPGLFGKGFRADGKTQFVLKGAALSPHRPLTISFWWCLPADMTQTTGFGLFELSGKGMVSAFAAGKGPWCALQRPAGVCQVYYFPGIQNVNGIYDFDLLKSLDLHAGVWHHSAAVFRSGSIFEFYTDGNRVSQIITSGRGWNAADDLTTLTFGSGVILDDVAILDRAIDADFVAEYYQGVKQLHRYRVSGPE